MKTPRSASPAACWRLAVSVFVAGLAARSFAAAADQGEVGRLAEAVRGLQPRVLVQQADGPQRDRLRHVLADDIRRRRDDVNRSDAVAWRAVHDRTDWEKLKGPRMEALRRSLGQFPAPPRDLHARIVKTLDGDGFRIDCIEFESRAGLVVTANLYRPAHPPGRMPGLLIAHSHHNPKTQGELQDMGMTWARHGCLVLVMDQLGHGQRRQHPYITAADFPAPFPVGRQDYEFRYNVGIQLHLIGESLMGWMVWDLMRGVDLLLSQAGVDPERIILLGSVAGGGDPAAVAAALDPRVQAAVPFNFGGPQPETVYPLPEDAARTFNYMGDGSWESTRNLRHSGRDGFLPWVIVGSIAPRGLVYGHEFSWDRDRDPVWQRLQAICGYYNARDRLASTHGYGVLRQTPAEASHCNNIGPPHRKEIYAAFQKWFGMAVPEEYQARRNASDLLCVADQGRAAVPAMTPVHRLAEQIAGQRLAAARAELGRLVPAARRAALRRKFRELLGKVDPEVLPLEPQPVSARGEGPLSVARVDCPTAGVLLPVIVLLPAASWQGPRPCVVGVAQEGKEAFLKGRSHQIARLLAGGVAVCLPDLRGTGETRPDDDRGRQSEATALASSEQMLGNTLLGLRLKDLRSVLEWLRLVSQIDRDRIAVWGDSFAPANGADCRLAVPYGIAEAPDRPRLAEPLGGLVALLAGLFDEDVCAVAAGGGLASFQSALDGQFIFIPYDVVLPGVLAVGDVVDLVAALAPRPVLVERMVDATNRPVAAAEVRRQWSAAVSAYQAEGGAEKLVIADGTPAAVDWLIGQLGRPGPAKTVLDGNSFWRFHVTLRKPVVPLADLRRAGKEASAPAVLPVEVSYRSYPRIQQLNSAPPPAGWNRVEFSDADWPSGRAGANLPASIAAAVFRPGVEFSTGLLCLRGKFSVAEPDRLRDLKLQLKYRGGVVVYLNGREIARQDVPDGAGPTAPAAAYPPEAFVDSAGKPLVVREDGSSRPPGGKGRAGPAAARQRSLGPIALPLDAVRPGINVLALELHRSDYHPSALSWFTGQNLERGCAWVPIGLDEARLTAAGGRVTPNVSRPFGLQVWNHDTNDRVNVLDYGDPGERLHAIVLRGARNGFFSGQVVVGSTEAIRSLRAVPSELVAAGGAKIPAAEIQVRYPVLDGHAYQQPDWFDGLRDAPPREVQVHAVSGAALQPVWITVHVPPGAAAGLYRGSLAISVRSETEVGGFSFPIELGVADWAIPDPRQFRTYVGIYQSPVSLAIQYQVPEWSEEHWRLVERSFRLLGEVGNKLVNVPLSEQTQLGNDEGMVYWVEKPDGTFTYDFSVLDRYLRLVKKHLGTPDFVALHVWHAGGWDIRGAAQRNTVTVLDPASGRRSHLQVPKFGTPQSTKFWQPALAAVRHRLAAQDMEQALCLGILSDGTAEPEVFKAFDEMLPGGARWTRGCHSATRETVPYGLKGGGTVVCHEYCYGMAMTDLSHGLPPVWKQRTWPGVAFIRHNFDDTLSLLKYRTMAERSLYCGTRGIGRIGLDFWDVLKDRPGQATNVYNRWPDSSCAQRAPSLFRLACPAPDGPAATVRFEQLREGVQEAEAMIVVAEALGEHAGELGPDLAQRCRQLLVERIESCQRTCPEAYGRVPFRTDHFGWRDLNARVYAAAAEVSRKLGR